MSDAVTDSKVIPLRKRPLDIAALGFFLINLVFVVYLMDIEQLTVADVAHPEGAVWPPRAIIALSHWYGNNFDPALMAREAYWRATIWIDVIFFGPFYAFASWAFIKGRNWIRIPTIMWATAILTTTSVILFEEFYGRHASPRPGMIVAFYSGYILMPLIILIRMYRAPEPFTQRA